MAHAHRLAKALLLPAVQKPVVLLLQNTRASAGIIATATVIATVITTAVTAVTAPVAILAASPTSEVSPRVNGHFPLAHARVDAERHHGIRRDDEVAGMNVKGYKHFHVRDQLRTAPGIQHRCAGEGDSLKRGLG